MIAEQLTPRVSTLAGGLNLVATLVQGFFAWSPLYSEGINMIIEADSCAEIGTGFGNFWRHLIVYIAPEEVFYNEVDDDVTDQTNN